MPTTNLNKEVQFFNGVPRLEIAGDELSNDFPSIFRCRALYTLGKRAKPSLSTITTEAPLFSEQTQFFGDRTMRTCVLAFSAFLSMATFALSANSQDPFSPPEPPSTPSVAEPNSPSTPDSPATNGKITQVTLYRDQALVTREIEVDGTGEIGVITVDSLPEMLIPDSVFAEGDESIAIRGVRVSSRPTTASDREEVRALQEQILKNQQGNAKLQQELRISQENLASLTQMANFSASKTSEDLNRGVLDANTLMEVSKFLMDQRREIMNAQLECEQQLTVLQQELSLLQRQLAELTTGAQRSLYEAKVFIDATGAGKVRLNYQVSGCGWSPQYAIRGNVGGDKFTIRYSALVQQISGEEWDQVALTLSTASPSVSSTGPTLTPFRVTPQVVGMEQATANEFGQFGYDSNSLSQRVQSIKKQQRSAENQAYGKGAAGAEVQRDFALNSLAAEMQQLELEAEAKTAARIAGDADDEVATQVYSLPKVVSLQSRRQQQLVQIIDMQIDGELYHVATPLLSSYAYREAEITNTEPIGLLGGPASVYLDDRFVGRSELPTTASGQKLVVGFGADQQVRIRRELRDKKDVLRGGNRNLEFTYRLVVANFKDQPVAVRLYDRIPLAAESRDVLINVMKTTSELSDDGLYERIAKGQGILRWDLEVPASSHGENAFDVEYTYNLDFDKNKVLTTEGLAQQTSADLFFQRAAGGMGGGMGGMGGMGGYPGGGAVLPPIPQVPSGN
jgi:hypothetical protein